MKKYIYQQLTEEQAEKLYNLIVLLNLEVLKDPYCSTKEKFIRFAGLRGHWGDHSQEIKRVSDLFGFPYEY